MKNTKEDMEFRYPILWSKGKYHIILYIEFYIAFNKFY